MAPGAGEGGGNMERKASCAQRGRAAEEADAARKVTWLNYPASLLRS